MKFKIVFRPAAEADLTSLYDYVAAESGHRTAGAYLDRIEHACMSLSAFPKRGMARDDLRPGLRLVGFERRAVIAFFVSGDEIVILRVLYGGRDFERLLRIEPDDV